MHELHVDGVVLDTAAGTVTAQFVVPAGHPVLAGHFPGQPLVPGVLLLDAVRLAVDAAHGRRHDVVAVGDVRWHAPLVPDTPATVTAGLAATGGRLAANGSWTAAGIRLGTFAIELVDADAAVPPRA